MGERWVLGAEPQGALGRVAAVVVLARGSQVAARVRVPAQVRVAAQVRVPAMVRVAPQVSRQGLTDLP